MERILRALIADDEENARKILNKLLPVNLSNRIHNHRNQYQ